MVKSDVIFEISNPKYSYTIFLYSFQSVFVTFLREVVWQMVKSDVRFEISNPKFSYVTFLDSFQSVFVIFFGEVA